MRKIGLLLCLGLLLGGMCMAQKQKEKDPLSLKLGVVIDKNETAKIEAPMFNGGEQALFKYIINNLRYPAQAMENNEQGRVLCLFTVNTDGSISNVRILQSVSQACDNEAIRLVKNMPKWIPGKKDGVITKMDYRLPLVFKLQQIKRSRIPLR